jgi:ribulose-bisphosphate carboxylase large chain
MDQSARYADLSLKEEDLIKGGKHILVAYKMKPKPGYRQLPVEAAALRRRVVHRHQR